MTHSYSRISLFERCPQAYEYRYILKLEEVKSKALINGIKKHDMCERYLKGKVKRVPKGVEKIAPQLERLKELHAVAEEWWNFSKSWAWSEKPKQWLVAKLDAYCVIDENVIEVVDFKTGKRYPAVKDQLALYAVCAFQAYDIEKVVVKAEYIDTGNSYSNEYSLDDSIVLRRAWKSRFEKLDKAKVFKKKPGFYCSFCPFHKDKGGPCSG